LRRTTPAQGWDLLRRELTVNRPLGETFAFFSDAGNLDRLTPPWVGFQILTPAPIVMGVGTLIDYRIRIRGMPIRWQTRIAAWDPPHRFVDVQQRGPYRWWHHEHRFAAVSGGTLVVDHVEYVPRMRWLTAGWVSRDLERIFEYRREQLAEIFGAR
jgi:ligand-binding SRPBCC domain-containing protein